MDFPVLHSHLVAEAARFKSAVLAADPKAVVPCCPDWDVTGLVDHVVEVYDDKVASMRLLREPVEADLPVRQGDVEARFDDALAELLGEFAARGPETLSYTWYGPDQTTGFWIRRMAQETLIHRVDAEQAAGLPVTVADGALAADGVDEFFEVMMAWGSRAYREWVGGVLEANDGLSIGFATEGRAWTVSVTPEGIDVTDGLTSKARATVSGSAHEVLLWLWRRTSVEAVTVEGDKAAAVAFYDMADTFAQ
ncbi:maleylpyruvate isomerase family mycothiol-dependent enzyme [Glycomyces sp. NPDC046736]|uniref:maleylpyruvate isomerase family mycothiol-dependent enzyme n=1 Tax=Glycomyces sp. NPDC046736 TaxID=3155615 RepID=UPI0033EAB088